MAERRLGRGLSSLIAGGTAAEPQKEESVAMLETSRIEPNPFQPRKDFPVEALNQLIESIRAVGVLQPVVTRPAGSGYQLIAGERRWRACRELGIEKIPAVVRRASDDQMLELALIENVQREELNPIERAQAFRDLMKNMGWTQDVMAKRVGLQRSSVANTIRLLDLPPKIQALVSRGTLAPGHARALLAFQRPDAMEAWARRAIDEDLSVRVIEKATRDAASEKEPRAEVPRDPNVRALEDELSELFSARVTVRNAGGRGDIRVAFADTGDLNRVVALLRRGLGPAR